MKIQAVIFDLDGTLIDSMGIWEDVDRVFLGRRNIAVPPDLFDDVSAGNNFQGLAQHFKDRFQLSESIDEIMKEWTEQVVEFYVHHIPIKDGVRELLAFLAKNSIPMAIGTSNSVFLTESVLNRHGLMPYFQYIVTGADVECGKPFPDIYLKTAQLLQVKPELCLVIEDSLQGVQAGKAAGMSVVAISDEFSRKEEDKIREESDYFFDNFQQIQNLLMKKLEV
ncbi:MAG TPA: HAD family phosphatase [Candidatus Cloacimonadota bacterium]|nr:HAD family phosphatase [Candidatus Cloacimonadota bacterium]HPT71924.1 HAD family phosphatase [Candidatus Cloacimonadota bacterium]